MKSLNEYIKNNINEAKSDIDSFMKERLSNSLYHIWKDSTHNPEWQDLVENPDKDELWQDYMDGLEDFCDTPGQAQTAKFAITGAYAQFIDEQ